MVTLPKSTDKIPCTAQTSLVRETILTVLRDCPGGVGYKSVWQTLNNKYNMNVRQ